MDFTISALAAERVADLRRDAPDPGPPDRPKWTWLRRRKPRPVWIPRPVSSQTVAGT